jgi:hypothetical protein
MRDIRDRTAEERRSVRNTQSRPLVEAMRPWLEMQLGRIPGRSGLADAIRYTLSRWPALCHFLDDGRIELDNNSVERAIRPVAMTESFCTPIQVFGNIKLCLSESTRHGRPFCLSAATTCSLARSAARI